MDDHAAAVARHWAGRGDLEILDARLRRTGRDSVRPSLEDLSALDQLHAGLLGATRELRAWAGLPEGARVLDVGAGLGGPARCLAAEEGCRVTALELSGALVRAGRELTARLGLETRVRHVEADFLSWTPDGPYDVVWLQHVDIHVLDKGRFYRLCRTALGPGVGRVLWHDWLAGPGGEPRYPLPWSRDGSISSLASRDELLRFLAGAGLRMTRFEAISERTAAWFETSRAGLARVLDAGRDVVGRERLERLLEEVESVLRNLGEARLVPFFGEARPLTRPPPQS